MTKRHSILPAIVLALALLATACSSDDDGDIDSGTGTTDATTTDDTTDGSTTTDTTTTTSESTTSTTEDTTTSSTGLPGEPWEGFAQDGDVFSVFGVADDDVLNVRSIPGTSGDIVATAEPTADDLVATGRARQLTGFWYEVTVDGVTGWVAVNFVAYEGGTDDATAEYLADGGPTEAETMSELGLLVAEGFASVDPPSTIVQSVAPSVGDLAEVTYDVVGLGDDAGAGYRLHIFAREADGGEGFTLRTIERTSFCLRGLAGELCV